ncbi:MAG: ribosome-binding factor A [Elusimicrobia bacterium HGW-Elusimicrobia-1]|jgi:ribosome-binding factor A|nr:MAG: ribosome-binding factor A [Elusimicrobia bacterium HGW-Elusimicrobia-1]
MSRRTDRVAKLLQQQISSLVFKLKKTSKAIITITDVTVSPDIKNAKVYFSVLNEKDAAAALSVLGQSVGFFSKHISKVLHTRNFPRLSFEYDATPERAAKVFEIFDKIEREKSSE